MGVYTYDGSDLKMVSGSGPNQVSDNTSTTLNGVLFGNGRTVSAKALDSADGAASTESVAEKLPIYGMGKNLLRNWYFVGGGSQQGAGIFPINSRGNTTYTGSTSTIDGWHTNE